MEVYKKNKRGFYKTDAGSHFRVFNNKSIKKLKIEHSDEKYPDVGFSISRTLEFICNKEGNLKTKMGKEGEINVEIGDLIIFIHRPSAHDENDEFEIEIAEVMSFCDNYTDKENLYFLYKTGWMEYDPDENTIDMAWKYEPTPKLIETVEFILSNIKIIFDLKPLRNNILKILEKHNIHLG